MDRKREREKTNKNEENRGARIAKINYHTEEKPAEGWRDDEGMENEKIIYCHRL